MKRTYLVCKTGEKWCDYSLSCGQSYEIYEGKGESLDEDIKILFEEIAYPEGRNEYCEFVSNSNGISEVFVVPIKTEIITMDIEAYEKEWIEGQKAKEKEGIEEKERIEYERLKKKFS